jgi:hypothetical protein
MGTPCGVDDDCVAGLRCEPNPIEPEIRVCTPKIADDQPCAPFTGNVDCQSGWCNSVSGVCEAQKEPGELCPDGDDNQCRDGYCQRTFFSCTTDPECLGSGRCNVALGRCEFYCVAFLADGSPCDADTECMSGACVATVCRTLPLPEGAECETSLQCESEFCNSADLPPVCATLPLEDGRNCFSAEQCASRICYGGMCNPGLPEGQLCAPTLPPCHPDLYCSSELDPATCVPRFDAGEVCDGDFQCRGDCVSAYGRMVCDATPPLGKAVCDGE